MPANLTPDYKRAEQAYRAAEDDRERLSCLKEMLRTIPKHKGTEHLQGDLKSRIRQLTEELAGPKKGAARTGPVHTVRPEGAAQIALLGPPNSGKSSLHAKLTGSRAAVAPYPHTTHEPMPGMLAYEDIHFQLIDLPPITADYIDSWLVNALQPAHAALLVVDVSDPACTDQIDALLARLDEKRISLVAEWPSDVQPSAAPQNEGDDEVADPFRIPLPALLVVNKIDAGYDPADLDVLRELTGVDFPSVAVSAQTGEGLDRIAAFLFRGLAIARVYTKAPGKPPEMDRPFTVRCGATVQDVARLVHKEIAASLKYARAWGEGVFDGQQVGPEHPVADRDVVELHMR
ncbi:MAG: 50S ribosome-binding GTPase [Gammaproteobacteria bacterium]|nr:50S ribosome-binding GTPase [Gammaproteobacteria bacterium]